MKWLDFPIVLRPRSVFHNPNAATSNVKSTSPSYGNASETLTISHPVSWTLKTLRQCGQQTMPLAAFRVYLIAKERGVTLYGAWIKVNQRWIAAFSFLQRLASIQHNSGRVNSCHSRQRTSTTLYHTTKPSNLAKESCSICFEFARFATVSCARARSHSRLLHAHKKQTDATRRNNKDWIQGNAKIMQIAGKCI